MTIVETVLVFLGIPLGVIALVAVGVYGRSAVHQPNRYRPGKAVDATRRRGTGRTRPRSTTWSATMRPSRARPTAVAVGGASGEW